MNEIEGLIERLEKATGPDRELDAHLLGYFGWRTDGFGRAIDPDGLPCLTIPDLLASLDAALALVERVRPGAWYRLGCGRNHPDEPLYGAQLLLPDVPGDEDGAVIGEGEHEASLALAVLIALLRTLETDNDA